MTTTPRSGHRKYIRSAKTPTVHITEDDGRLLLETYRHDILDTKAVFDLLAPRSEDAIRRRLRRLFDAKLLQRLQQREREFVPGGGSLPVTFTLDVAGARWVREKYGLKLKTNRYRGRNKRLTGLFIAHTLEQARFILQVRTSAERRDDVEFLYPDEIYRRFAPHILDKPSLPQVVSAPVHWHQFGDTQGTIPDGFFMLYYKNQPKDKQQYPFFLEIDRGTETIEPGVRKQKNISFWRDSSLLKKFVVYGYAFKAKTHTADFGIDRFSVLTVTTNSERVKQMQTTYSKCLGPRPHSIKPWCYLFTDFATVAAHKGDILAVPFEDGEGKVVRFD